MITAQWSRPWREQLLRDPKSIFGGGGAALPPAPTVTPPPNMPDPNSPDALAARKLAMTKAMNGGRQSTQLTTAPLAAGGGPASFSSTKTGA
jgi:hypothetical protein